MSYANEFKAKFFNENFEEKAKTPSLKREACITQGDLSKWPKNSEAAADSVK